MRGDFDGVLRGGGTEDDLDGKSGKTGLSGG